MHGQTIDLLVENGKIKNLSKSISDSDAKLIEADNLHVSAGWIDLHAHFQDPGYEYKEDLKSGSQAAALGGFTRVCLSPLCEPIADSKSQIEYIYNRRFQGPVELMPYGSVSKQAKGSSLAELADMKSAGAIAFSDDKNSIQNPNLLSRALLYAQAVDGLVMNFPNTHSLAPKGVMNEGEWSTKLGLKGIPELSEDLMVSRDIDLVKYTNGRLHFAYLSSPNSLELVKKAKKEGLGITCDVPAHHLIFTDEALVEFDSRYKTMPPLRSESSVKALIKAVKSGLIDALCSDHWPEDIEAKKRELDHAAFGVIGLQTAFAAANTALKSSCELSEIIALFTSGPSKVLGLEETEIKIGEAANLTLFNPEAEIEFSKEQVVSKSQNSPFFAKKLKGKVIGVLHNNKLAINPA